MKERGGICMLQKYIMFLVRAATGERGFVQHRCPLLRPTLSYLPDISQGPRAFKVVPGVRAVT